MKKSQSFNNLKSFDEIQYQNESESNELRKDFKMTQKRNLIKPKIRPEWRNRVFNMMKYPNTLRTNTLIKNFLKTHYLGVVKITKTNPRSGKPIVKKFFKNIDLISGRNIVQDIRENIIRDSDIR